MKTVLLFLLCLTSFWVAAQTCTIEFKIKNAGFQVEGTMTAGKIEFNFNHDSLNSSSVVAQDDP
jgi:hypothetical protein